MPRPGYDRSMELTWKGDDQLVVGDTTFKTLPPSGFAPEGDEADGSADFLVAKPRWLIERYISLLGELRPQRILELGMFQGGSTALFADVARPKRFVGVDRLPGERTVVHEYASKRGFGDVLRTFGGVDQADRARLAELVGEEFDGPLDLVIDDCSHEYEATRSSFNELFPRLRQGGVYAIEDWPWAHTPLDADFPEGMFPDQIPLTRLIFEIVLAIPSVPGLIEGVEIERGAAFARRGDAEMNAADFDISSCSNPRGRELLAPP